MATGTIRYLSEMRERPVFYAVDHARDNLNIKGVETEIRDLRGADEPASLAAEGFVLAHHKSAVQDFRDADELVRVYVPEMAALLQDLTGAERVLMFPNAVLRFAESSPECGSRLNSYPARFAHIDYTDASAPGLLQPLLAANPDLDLAGRRVVGYNLWRAFSGAPVDVPLALCDARSVAPGDLARGDAVFDAPDAPEWRFEAYLARANAAHRWSYCSAMTPEDVLVFRAWDSDPARTQGVPHVAFDDPDCPAGAPPRASVEVRGFAIH